jgi:hypothetical protein
MSSQQAAARQTRLPMLGARCLSLGPLDPSRFAQTQNVKTIKRRLLLHTPLQTDAQHKPFSHSSTSSHLGALPFQSPPSSPARTKKEWEEEIYLAPTPRRANLLPVLCDPGMHGHLVERKAGLRVMAEELLGSRSVGSRVKRKGRRMRQRRKSAGEGRKGEKERGRTRLIKS